MICRATINYKHFLFFFENHIFFRFFVVEKQVFLVVFYFIIQFAAHRRQAALNEIQRLKVEATLLPQGHTSQNVPLEKGTLEITDITLPLKKEYVRALAAGIFFVFVFLFFG